MRRVAGLVAAGLLAAGCGQSLRERVEDAVRTDGQAAGEVAAVRCEPAGRMWGCRVRLRDGRTQACQVAVERDEPRGAVCQPLRGE